MRDPRHDMWGITLITDAETYKTINEHRCYVTRVIEMHRWMECPCGWFRKVSESESLDQSWIERVAEAHLDTPYESVF